MASNSTPTFMHRIVFRDPKTDQRHEVPVEKTWKAVTDAKDIVKNGAQGVEIQTWNRQSRQFEPNDALNDKLAAEKPRVQINYSAMEKVAELTAMSRDFYSAVSRGKQTGEEYDGIVALVEEIGNILGYGDKAF